MGGGRRPWVAPWAEASRRVHAPCTRPVRHAALLVGGSWCRVVLTVLPRVYTVYISVCSIPLSLPLSLSLSISLSLFISLSRSLALSLCSRRAHVRAA